MKIEGNSINVNKKLQPLFDAMKNGKRIKQVIIMNGKNNSNDRTQDVIIRDFIASDYDARSESNFVRTDKENFYMSWIIDYIIK
jgi:hypothetical protein